MESTLLSRVRSMSVLGPAWRVIHENGNSSHSPETRREVAAFAENAEENLTRIQRQLNKNAFVFMPSRGIPIEKKGKGGKRPLVVAPVESRIVQRAILEVLLSVPEIRGYAENPYSFGGVRKKHGKQIAGVPAAVEAVLGAIEAGAKFAIRSDISTFFTKISKPFVTSIVERATQDPPFVELFKEAITVELENLAELQQDADLFPLYEVGVAQGCSLSPLLGNLLLSRFDEQMNLGACRCFRYVDDFLILAPDGVAAESQFSLGVAILKSLGLRISSEKTVKGKVGNGFEFLGIELNNGIVRPSKESRKRFLTRAHKTLQLSVVGFRAAERARQLSPRLSLVRTFTEVSGIVQGWGKQYFFCNDRNLLSQLDHKLDSMIRGYLGAYSAVSKTADRELRRQLLGVPLLEKLPSRPFGWRAA